MVVLIATFAVTDLRALIAVAGANACMILFGLLMERVNLGRERLDWLPFWFGCVAGAVPWVVIGISLVGSEIEGSVPGFVWGIFVSLFLFFNSFAVNTRGCSTAESAPAPLRLRGVGLPRPQPDGEERARVADLRRRARDLSRPHGRAPIGGRPRTSSQPTGRATRASRSRCTPPACPGRCSRTTAPLPPPPVTAAPGRLRHASPGPRSLGREGRAERAVRDAARARDELDRVAEVEEHPLSGGHLIRARRSGAAMPSSQGRAPRGRARRHRPSHPP